MRKIGSQKKRRTASVDPGFHVVTTQVAFRLLSSASYHASYVSAELEDGEEATVKWYVEREAPPRAANQASVTENCQGWVIRVLKQLQTVGIVTEERVAFVEGIKEPI